MNQFPKIRLVAIGAIALILVVAGCSGGDPAATPDPEATSYVASMSLSDVDLASTIGIASDIPGLFPNHEFEVLGGNYVANSQVVVTATPTKVEPGQATVWGDGTAEVDQGEEVAFGDPAAQSRTWFVTLRVESTIAGDDAAKVLPGAAHGEQVTVRLTSDGGKLDQNKYESGILGLGRSVWFLTAFEDQPGDSFGVAWFGGAVAAVADDGSLEFKLLSPQRRQEIDESSYTVDKLEELATGPVVRIPRDQK